MGQKKKSHFITTQYNSHEADNGNNLEHGKDKLGLAVRTHTTHVDGEDDGEKYSDVDGIGVGRVPVTNRQGRSNDFEWHDDEPLEGIA